MLTTSKLVEKLKTNFFFKKAPDVAASLGSLKSSIVEVPEGKLVFQNGEPSENVYLILYGLVKIKIKTKTGAKIVSRAAGDFFGEREVLEGKERTSTAITEIDSEFFVLSRERFLAYLYGNDEIRINVKINLAKTYDLTKEGAETIIDNNEPDGKQFSISPDPDVVLEPVEVSRRDVETVSPATLPEEPEIEVPAEEPEEEGVYDDFDFDDEDFEPVNEPDTQDTTEKPDRLDTLFIQEGEGGDEVISEEELLREVDELDEAVVEEDFFEDDDDFEDFEDDDFELGDEDDDDFRLPEEDEDFVEEMDDFDPNKELELLDGYAEPPMEIEEPDYDLLNRSALEETEEEPYFEAEGDFSSVVVEMPAADEPAEQITPSEEEELRETAEISSSAGQPVPGKITIVNSGETIALRKQLELITSVCTAERPVDIYDFVKEDVLKLVNAKEFVMFVFDGGFLSSVTGHISEDTNFAVREKIAYELITMQEPVTLFDLDSSGMMEGLENIDEKEIPSSLLYYPLIGRENKVNGCFLFFSSNNGRFTTHDVMSLEDIAKAASGILDKIADGKTSLTGKYEDLQKYTAFFGSEIKIAVETILSISETLDRGKLTDKVRYGFDIIRERAAGLKGFLDSIQFFVGKVSGFSKQPYLVSGLLDDFLVKVSEPAKQREVTLLRKYNADMVMFFNKELFIHALTLITQNSFDAMPEGGKIYFSTSANESNILISIRDTGTGIHPDLREKIFEPFYTYGKTGVGLGLPIANKIIKEHGGFIYLESTKTQGTEIIIALPV